MDQATRYAGALLRLAVTGADGARPPADIRQILCTIADELREGLRRVDEAVRLFVVWAGLSRADATRAAWWSRAASVAANIGPAQEVDHA